MNSKFCIVHITSIFVSAQLLRTLRVKSNHLKKKKTLQFVMSKIGRAARNKHPGGYDHCFLKVCLMKVHSFAYSHRTRRIHWIYLELEYGVSTVN